MPVTETGTMAWSDVERSLVGAQNYWVVTTGPDGMPQPTPVWAVWLDDRLWFSCGSETVKARNIARQPRVAVHLESGDQPVVVRGIAEPITTRDEPRIIAAMRAKYGPAAVPDSFAALAGLGFCVRPISVLSWSEFPSDVTHWDPPGPMHPPMAPAAGT